MKRILSALFLSAVLAFATTGAAFAQHSHQSDDSKQTITKSDGSVVVVTVADDGTKTEVRTFKTGDIARITRTTHSNGHRTVEVEYRDGRTANIEEESDIEQAMDATADRITAAASKTKETAKEITSEVSDKAEDAADKVVEKSKDAGKVAVKGVKVTADKAEDVADKTVDTTKEAGKAVADKAEDVEDKAVAAGKVVGDKAEDVADKTVDTTKDVAKEGKQKAKATGNWMARSFKKVGGFFKSIFD